MLSKKMAVSLTGLIAILTLAFVAPAVQAADFGVALDMTNDISDAAGLQLEYPTDNKLKVKVVFEEAVVLPKANISIAGFDMRGVYLPAVKLDGDPPTDAKDEIELTIAITGDTSRVALMIAEGIASADFSNADMSAELSTDIWVYKSVTGLAPSVYGIRRNPDSPLALTGGAVNLVVTLSEMPASFTPAHINVASNNATVSSVTPLDRVPQNKVDFDAFSAHTALEPFKVRSSKEIRDGLDRNDKDMIKGDGEYGIEYYLSTAAKDATDAGEQIPGKYIAEVRALKTKLGDTSQAEVSYYYDNKDGVQQSAAMIEHEATVEDTDGKNVSDNDQEVDANDEKGMPIGEDGHTYKDMIIPPSKQGTMDLVGTGEDAITILKEEFDRSKKAKDYARPKAGGFPNADDYNFALSRYNLLTLEASTDGADNNASDQRAAYVKENDIYKAYIALEAEIKADDMMKAEGRQKAVVNRVITGTDTAIPENVLPPTGRDGMLHPYLVSLMPAYANANNIVVRVNEWDSTERNARMSGEMTVPNSYKPPTLENGYRSGFNSLTLQVNASAVKTTPTVAQGPIVISLPFAVTIPAASPGFLIFAANAAGSGISIPGGVLSPDGLTTATAAARRPVERLYNIVDMSIASAAHATVEPLPNLQNFLRDGGTIHLSGPAGLVISEVMWGTDASLSPHSHSQWIEIKNVSGAPLTSPAGTLNLHFIGPHETLAAGTPVVDSVGTVAATGGVWNIFTRGRAGRTGTGEQAAGVTTVVAQQDVISMQRVFSDTAQRMPEAGNLQTSWAASTGPALNFDRDAIGRRIGSPGTEPLTPPPPTPPAPATPPAPSTPIAGADDIMITEIMVDTSSDRFPQWIEITHVGIGKASLNGWTMVVDNAIDGEVLGGGNAITLKLDGVELDVSKDIRNAGAGQSLLVVAWASGRKSGKIRSNGVLDVGPQLGQKGRYQLLSYEGFRITLVPPQTSAIATFGDRVGNLDEDWNILMLEGPKRSSMIRREMSTAGVPFDGTESAGWVLASATPLIAGPETYYGNDEDAGTPGYDAGGPLPVELSHFRPARDKQTGAVVITWATQSELNNAGFYIKRSNQRNGQFVVVNPTMVAGAGTTSEKQSYTYTDTTAQPNVVYYYQIEDVSLDGQRQTLTNGIRLKGHIGAAGKATTLWGELKSSNE